MHIKTVKDQTKQLRRGTDDVRRIALVCREVAEAIHKLRPACVGIEQYTVYEPRWIGQMTKAARTVVDLNEAAGMAGGLTGAASKPEWLEDWLSGASALEKALGASGERGGGVGLGQAAKTLMVWGAVIALCAQFGTALYVFTPADVKRRVGVGGRARASKQDVLAWAKTQVHGFEEDLSARRIAPSNQDHVSDAAVLGVLAAEAHGMG
jgi:Holliday junction resolvasome RuvABC endonuclease subunit